MTFTKGWLNEQIRSANETIETWTAEKQEVMVREDLCPLSCDGSEAKAGNYTLDE